MPNLVDIGKFLSFYISWQEKKHWPQTLKIEVLISNQSLKVIIDTLISCLYLNAALTDVTLELVVYILLQWILSQRNWHFKCFPNTLLLKTIQDFDFTSEGQASYHHASFQWQTVLAMLHDFLYIDSDHIHFTFYIKANVFNNSIKRKVPSVIPTLIKREKWYTLKLSILSKVTSLIDGEVMTLSRHVCVSVSFFDSEDCTPDVIQAEHSL